MNKLAIQTILVVVLVVILVIPSALFIDIFSHELYHVSKNKQYSEEICLNINDITAYTIVNFPDYTTSLKYNEEVKDKEEVIANRVGKIASLIYAILVIIIFSIIIYLKK